MLAAGDWLSERRVPDRFFAIAAAHAERPALAFQHAGGWSSWSYRELADRANQIADRLHADGVRAGEAVGVISARTPDTIAALIAILELGAHYVPLDPAYPEPRLRLMREIAQIRHWHAAETVSGPRACAPPRPAAPPGPPPAGAGDGEAPAYLMFTSGSTGEPKAVIVPHRAILRLINRPNFMQMDASRTFLALAPMGFDASTLEIWGPLLNGGKCVLYPDHQLPTAAGLRAVLVATGVNSLWLTASLFNALVDQDPACLAGVEELLTGGEALSVPHVCRALESLKSTQLINGYGPTENTTFTSCFRIPRNFPSSAPRVPIGMPVSGTQIAVVDAELQPVRPGAEGELLAMGEGLALGYLGQPAQTRERFIDWSGLGGPPVRAYRTGDRVKQGADGMLEFLGRMDEQVKIDGHRIEPEEVERALAALPGVQDCRVLVRTGPAGQRRLAAYVVADAAAQQRDLRSLLSATLPAFLVPHFIVFLAALPLNANGKLDKPALPDPFAGAASPGADGQTPLAALVSAAWFEVLGRHPASGDVNFFDAGGTSLEAVRLHELLAQRLGRELEPAFLFEHTTIRRQAAALGAAAPLADSPAVSRGQARRSAQVVRPRRGQE